MAVDVRFGFVLGLTMPNLFGMHAEWAIEAEQAGADLLSVGEVPVLTPDPYLLLHSMANHTERAIVGPVVSMPGLMHPAVHARTLVTLQELTGGRVFLGIGRGRGGLELLGETPAKWAETIEYTRAVRDLCAGEKTVYHGKELQLTYEPRRVPVLLSGFGPRGYEVAGRYCDGMIVGNGATPERAEMARTFARAGAEAEGRSFDDLEIWDTIRIHVAESEEQGLEDLGFYMSRVVHSEYTNQFAVSDLDDEMKQRILAYKEEAVRGLGAYSFEPKAQLELLDRFGLKEWAARQYFITGPIDEIAPRVRELVDAGVRNFIVPQMLPDIVKSSRDIGELFARVRSDISSGVPA